MSKIPAPKIADRWEDGVDHEPGSIELVRLIMEMDIQHLGDRFELKIGGDGDNGEDLAYLLDALIENELIKIEIINKEAGDER